MRPILVLAVLLLAPFAIPAHAAQSYDNCTSTIASLPAVIATQGTWCLKWDLATALTSGNIITVATNNVTIDCNGFKLGNLAAGIGTQTTGIRAEDRVAVTVRGCNLRGFRDALNLSGNGHVIEDNRIEASRNSAVRTSGDYMIIRRNLIIDTGGQNHNPEVIFFFGDADVRDNIINGVFPGYDGQTSAVYGIHGAASSAHYTIRGNVVRGMSTLEYPGFIYGIYVWTGEGDIIDNTLSAYTGLSDGFTIGVYCEGGDGFVRDNRATGFVTVTGSCPNELGGNELRN